MNDFQMSLFYDYQAIIANSDFYRKYDAIFSALDLSDIPEDRKGPGRPPYPKRAFVRAFIIKHLEEIKSVPRLIEFLDAHPMLADMCGFTMGNLPDESQFYRFLKDTTNSPLQTVHPYATPDWKCRSTARGRTAKSNALSSAVH